MNFDKDMYLISKKNEYLKFAGRPNLVLFFDELEREIFEKERVFFQIRTVKKLN